MSANDPELSKVLVALGHEKRRRIVMLLAERGPLSVTELKREMKISTGSLYHNISLLGDLIGQEQDRRYALTEKGRRVNQLLSSGILAEPREPLGGRLRSIASLLIPRWIFLSLAESRLRAMVITAAVLIAGIVLSYPARSNVTLLLVERSNSNPILQSLSLPLSWIAVSGILLVLFSRGNINSPRCRNFVFSSAASYSPQIAYLALEAALSGTSFATSGLLLFGVASLIFSGLGVCLLATALATNLNVPIERALIACLVLFYISSILSYLVKNI